MKSHYWLGVVVFCNDTLLLPRDALEIRQTDSFYCSHVYMFRKMGIDY